MKFRTNKLVPWACYRLLCEFSRQTWQIVCIHSKRRSSNRFSVSKKYWQRPGPTL